MPALLVLLVACSGGLTPEGRHGQPPGQPQPGDSAPTGDTSAETEPEAPWSFVVFGDNQFSTSSCTSGIEERESVPELILSLEPDAVLHTGDLMDHGYDDGAYEWFEGCYQDMLGALPFFPTPGNHDMGSGGLYQYEPYLERQLFETNPGRWSGCWDAEVQISYEDDPQEYSEDFDNKTHEDDVPSGVSFETFYAARIHNAYLISFEQGTRWWTNTPRSWLEGHLAAARDDPTIDHLFVIMHHPMYSTKMAEDGDSECVGPVREDYEDLFRAYDVTVAFSGHTHIYEHFAVPDDGSATRRDASAASYVHDGSAVHYVVTGGGGGPLPDCDPLADPREEFSADYLQGRGCGYHVTRVQVDGSELSVEVIGVDGGSGAWTTTTWESWELTP